MTGVALHVGCLQGWLKERRRFPASFEALCGQEVTNSLSGSFSIKVIFSGGGAGKAEVELN